MGQGWWGWGEERDGDTKQNKPTRPTKGKMKSSAFVHRTVRCWRRKVSWCRGGAQLPYPARRAPGGARREAGAGARTWERAGAVGLKRRGVEAGGSLEPQGGE